MPRPSLILVICAALALTTGCSVINSIRQDERDHDAILAALNKYVAERSGIKLSAVNMEVQEFNTDRDSASLYVLFTSKQGTSKMQRKYTLTRKAGVWSVSDDTLVFGAIPGAGPGAGNPSATPAGKPGSP